MDAERLRAYLLTLPHVVETMQWGANLVFWTGDKAIGGKMFALINLDEPAARETHLVLSYAAGPARYSELLEIEGLVPAPYMARIHWVAASRWDIFSSADWKRELEAAHAPDPRPAAEESSCHLRPPRREAKTLIATRRKILAAKAKK